MSSSHKEKAPEPPQFPLFRELPDPAQFHVVSFLATAPFESIHSELDSTGGDDHGGNALANSKGTLVRTLPFVCKKFRDFCHSEPLWQASLERALSKDPVWSDALLRWTPNLDTNGRDGRLIPALLRHTNVSSCKNLYQNILNEELRVRLPVFLMPMNDVERTPNLTYQLHFFEPRYRLMMAELMQGLGEAPGDDGPVFLHIIDMQGPNAKAAALVRVVRCQFARDGRCLVELKVIGRVRVQRCWVRPQSHSLYYADGFRYDSIPLTEPVRQGMRFYL